MLCLVIILCNNINILSNPTERYVKIDRKTIVSELEIGAFLQVWDRTKTVKGGFSLQLFLMNPVNDKRTLLDRQHFIKRLVDEQEAFEKIQKALSDIAETEQAIFTYFRRENNDFLKMLNSLYSTTPGIRSVTNFNSATQQGWFFFKLISSFLPIFGAVGGKQLAWELYQKTFESSYKINTKIFTYGAVGELFKQHSPWRNIDTHGAPLTSKQGGQALVSAYPRDFFDYLRQDEPPIFESGKSKIWHSIRYVLYQVNRTRLGAATSFFSAIIPTIFWDFYLYQNLDASKNVLNAFMSYISLMQQHCCKVRKYVDALQTILQVQKEYGLFTNILPNITEVLSNEHFGEIVSTLDTKTLEEQATFLFYHGRVMHAHKLMNDHFELFMPLTNYIAELDTYMSIAQVYRECQSSDHPFSFVNYIDTEDGAIIESKDAWHPLLFGKSIKQDIHLGVTSDTQHMVITGPNWSGKSIGLKTVGLIVYLGHALTIVPARSCSLTLFDQIGTCLDPVGDVSKGLSKFKKQKNDLENFKNAINESSSSNKVLLLIDEILSGTVDDMIAQKTIEFGTSISANKNAVLLISTHVFEPTELEVLTKGLFKNFHVEIIPQDDGSFTRTFRLVRGSATWWFDPKKKILRSRFIDWVNEESEKEKAVKITQ